jgi:hypothetical protein
MDTARKFKRNLYLLSTWICVLVLLAELVSCSKTKSSTDEALRGANPARHTKSIREDLQGPVKGDLNFVRTKILAMSAAEVDENSTEVIQFSLDASAEDLCRVLDSININSESGKKLVIFMMMQLSKKDGEAYIRHACQLESSSNLLLPGSMLASVLKLDPTAAIRFIESGDSNSASGKKLAASLLETMMYEMPLTGLAILTRVNPPNRESLMSKAYQALGQEDAQAALANAKGSLDQAMQPGMISSIIEGAALRNPAQAFQLAQAEGIDLSNKAYKVIFSEWLTKNPGEADLEVSKLPTKIFVTLFENDSATIASMSTRNSEMVMKFLGGIELTGSTRAMFESTLNAVTENNPQNTLEFLGKIPAGTIRDDLLSKTYQAWATKDQEAATKAILPMSGESRDGALVGLITAIAARDPVMALKTASQLPHDEQAFKIAGVLEVASGRGVDVSLKLLDDAIFTPSILEKPEIQRQIERMAVSYAERSLDACRIWTESLTDGKRPAAVGGLVTSWMKSDPTAAAAWLQKLEGGSAKNAGIHALVAEIRETDPSTAANWEALIDQ